MITKEKTRCKYVKVANDLYKNMIHGNLTGCEYMRSENALVRYYKVNRKTIRKALDKLETEGAIAPVKNQKRRLLIGDRKNSEFYVGFAVYGNAQKQDIGNQCKASIFDEITFCFQRQHAKTFKILFDKHHPEYIPETLNSEAVDIFIVNSNINLDIIKNLGKNYIIFDPSLDQLDNFTIGFNGTKLGYDAYSYLYQKGHRKIGILKSNVNYFFYDQVYTGYYCAVRNYNLHGHVIECIRTNSFDSCTDAEMKKVIEQIRNLDAIILPTNVKAGKFLNFLKEHKISVPDDISVIAIGGYDDCEDTEPPLSCYENDYEKAARAICEYARNIHSKVIQTPGHFAINSSCLVERKSVKNRKI